MDARARLRRQVLAVAVCLASVAAVAVAAPGSSGAVRLRGLVMLKYSDRNGRFENFRLQVGRKAYTVVTNFYDGRRPLTRVVNLRGKEAPAQFVQVANVVTVTGVIGRARMFGLPVLRASVVVVATAKDRGG